MIKSILLGMCFLSLFTNCTKDELLIPDEPRTDKIQVHTYQIDDSSSQDEQKEFQSLSSEEYDKLKYGSLLIEFQEKGLQDIRIENVLFSYLYRGCSNSDKREIIFQFVEPNGGKVMKLYTPFLLMTGKAFSTLYKDDSYPMATKEKINVRNGMKVELDAISYTSNYFNTGKGKIRLTSLNKNQTGAMKIVSKVKYYTYLDRYFVRFDIEITCDLYRKDNVSEVVANDAIISTSILSPLYRNKF